MIPPDESIRKNITSIKAEDLQDEDKLRKIMKMPPLTEVEVRQNDEKILKLQERQQKQTLKQQQRIQARSVKSNLHQKTHYKAVSSMLVQEGAPQSFEDGSAH